MTQHQAVAEQVAVKQANLMLDRRDHERQVEWLRVAMVVFGAVAFASVLVVAIGYAATFGS